jgi:hypothetical protein
MTIDEPMNDNMTVWRLLRCDLQGWDVAQDTMVGGGYLIRLGVEPSNVVHHLSDCRWLEFGLFIW